jgi:hypothetical protein
MDGDKPLGLWQAMPRPFIPPHWPVPRDPITGGVWLRKGARGNIEWSIRYTLKHYGSPVAWSRPGAYADRSA